MAPHRPPMSGASEIATGTVVVTGASGGIGRAVALGLASRGRDVVMVARNRAPLEELVRQIRSQAPRTSPAFHLADLSLQTEVRRVTGEIRDAHPRIDALVNNAGAWFHHREETPEGVERTWALNVLAPLLLTEGLRPALRAAAPSRVVMVSSAAHWGYELDLEDLESRRRYRGFNAYGRSKLAVILLTRVLAERYRADGISVNALHPGFIRSHFGQNNPGAVGRGMWVLTRLGGRSPEQGARTPIRLVTAPELSTTTGEYFVRGSPSRASRTADDAALGRRLFAVCATRLRLEDAGSVPGARPVSA
jgi:NAD(P)-dependent dehydrogenase (short-subunit alcohol dehydrogenase family)